MKARIALEQRGVKREGRYINLFTLDQMKPQYPAINPNGFAPTLVHDGVAETEG